MLTMHYILEEKVFYEHLRKKKSRTKPEFHELEFVRLETAPVRSYLRGPISSTYDVAAGPRVLQWYIRRETFRENLDIRNTKIK